MKQVAAAHPELVHFEATDLSITLNGIGDGEHEDFVFPGRNAANFVKTAGKPYDAVVAECLRIASRTFPAGQLEVTSDDEGDEVPALPARAFAPFRRWSGLLYPAAMALLFYFVFMRSRGGTNWSSYYLFWILAPAAISLLFAHPLVLLAIPAALVARRWLPDPWLALKHAGRIRGFEADVRANAENVIARRNLAVIWLEKRRPARALALLDQALVRDSESPELHFLRGLSLLALRRYEEAVDALVSVC